MSAQRAWANPYVAGCALGLVLLAAFVLTGRGLGASGAFASAAAASVAAVDAAQAQGNAWFATYLADGGFGADWLVVEVLGVLVGAALSAALSGRMRWRIERGPRLRALPRLACAAGGGAAMGIGALLARGCTSGQALSGGALLSVGSFVFMIAAFAAGYATMPLLGRLWR